MFCINYSDALHFLAVLFLSFDLKIRLLTHKMSLKNVEDIDTFCSFATCNERESL